MAIRNQTWEWSNLAPSGSASTVGRQNQSIPVTMVVNQSYDIFTGPVGNQITIPPATRATQFVVIEDLAVTPSASSFLQLRVNTTEYFQNPDGTVSNGIPAIAIPYPCGASSTNSATGTQVVQTSFRMHPALYVLPGQTWTMLYKTLEGITGGASAEATAVGAMVFYTLYDGPDALLANKLLEMGLPVNVENVDWLKFEMMSKNLASLTQTGGVA